MSESAKLLPVHAQVLLPGHAPVSESTEVVRARSRRRFALEARARGEVIWSAPLSESAELVRERELQEEAVEEPGRERWVQGSGFEV